MWYTLIGFAATTAFAVWVLFFDGAEELEGSLTSAFLFHPLAPTVSSSALKAIAFVAWLAQLILLLIIVFS